MTDSVIVNKVLEQIKEDVEAGDLSALEELLVGLKDNSMPLWKPVDYLVNYISEE